MPVLDLLSERAINVFLGNEEHSRPNSCHYLSVGDALHSILSYSNLPEKKTGMVRIIIISDTHERHTKLHNFPKGDILIHCGDVLMTSRLSSVMSGLRKLLWFNEWIKCVPCKHKIVIGGNHDGVMEKVGKIAVQSVLSNAIYLENDLIECEGLRIWGTPYSAGKSSNKAFQSEDFKTSTMQKAPLFEVDILLTHGHCPELEEKVPHTVHLWGHAHSSYGVRRPPMVLNGSTVRSLSICAPIMDKYFRPAHLPFVLDMPSKRNILGNSDNPTE
jgi:predicted phosphodiesterase